MKSSKKGLFFRILLVLTLFLIYITFSVCSYVSAVSSDISDSVFRLHVIANSDSEEDQNLKYKVRDSLLEYMNSILSENATKEEAMSVAKDHMSDFYVIAREVVSNEGYDYLINITIGKYDFPTKDYGDISLPSGNYDALRVEIGEASGHNWWCVMFPPLCFVDVTSGVVPDESKEALEDSLSGEEYDLITSSDNNADITFKFKLVEFIENVKMNLAKR